MITKVKNEIINNSSDSMGLLLQNLQQYLIFDLSKNSLLINNPFNEENKINQIKFLTNKRGRRRKTKIKKNENDLDKNLETEKVHDKYSNDNIKRRIKAFFHKYIISLLNNLIKENLKQYKFKFVKMNSKITKNIAIEYNRGLLNTKLKDIIVDISNKYPILDNNKNCIKFIESQPNNEKLIQILNMTYNELYNNYLNSNKKNTVENSYEVHKEILMKEYGKKYLKKFEENAETLVNFFINGKIRKSKKEQIVNTIDIPLENDITESNTNEIENTEKYKIKKVMVSSYVQTDLCDINSKLICFG